jgi:uncharacterized protein YdeI (YjbR/CyaY-like superfamily)
MKEAKLSDPKRPDLIMLSRDKRIDAYIAKAPDFAKPILAHIRETFHAACPDVEETVKRSHPTFMHHGILAGMAAFKEHATLGFWKGKLILDKNGSQADEAMGSFGRLTSIKDLPPRTVLTGYIKKAMQLNEDGVKVVKPKTKPKPAPKAPPYLLAAFRQNKKAAAHYAAMSPSMQREYVDWLTEAKTDATRQRRLQTAVAWIAEGKKRNWKYENC